MNYEQSWESGYAADAEIRELRSEVARHHRDFERVRAVLDRYEIIGALPRLCADIRAIVG